MFCNKHKSKSVVLKKKKSESVVLQKESKTVVLQKESEESECVVLKQTHK